MQRFAVLFRSLCFWNESIIASLAFSLSHTQPSFIHDGPIYVISSISSVFSWPAKLLSFEMTFFYTHQITTSFSFRLCVRTGSCCRDTPCIRKDMDSVINGPRTKSARSLWSDSFHLQISILQKLVLRLQPWFINLLNQTLPFLTEVIVSTHFGWGRHGDYKGIGGSGCPWKSFPTSKSLFQHGKVTQKM